MSRFFVEFVGTFLLVLTTGLVTVQPMSPLMVAIATASVYVAAIYAGGPIGDTHCNPAVSLAFFMRGGTSAATLRNYVGAQLGAAILGGFVAVFLRGGSATRTTPLGDHVTAALTVEFLFTFTLAWVFLSVATSKSGAGNSWGPVAVGFVMLAGGVAVQDISHAAFNPAVALSLAVLRSAEWTDLWVYFVADFSGAAAAAAVFEFLQLPPKD